jgi:hypothetical protein
MYTKTASQSDTMNNKAAWLKEAKAKPLQVDEAPYCKPESNQVVIRNSAVAINPVDWKIQVRFSLSSLVLLSLTCNIIGCWYESFEEKSHHERCKLNNYRHNAATIPGYPRRRLCW